MADFVPDEHNITLEDYLGNFTNNGEHKKEPLEKPRTYLVPSILSILLCGSLIGFIAVWHSIKVIRLWNKGREIDAIHISRTTKYWCILSYIVPIILWICVIIGVMVATPIILPLIASFLSVIGGMLSLIAPTIVLIVTLFPTIF